MTGNDLLIDTNIIIDVFNGNQKYADKLNKLDTIYVPSSVLGELYVGINRVQNKAKHLQILNDFL
jgi:tRNA(fMet)-specific endonuclease VapC